MEAITVRLHRTGGPEQLVVEPLDLTPPAPGEVRVRHAAIGVNFVDVYHRTGVYPMPGLPWAPGVEGAGVIEACGAGVTTLAPGQRVAYAIPLPGSYASARNVPADRVLALPAALDDAGAAALLLKGVTVHMLLARVLRVQAGQTLLVHAAAGGLGLMLTQWASALGVRVIGTVGGAEKAALARSYGLAHAIDYRREDFVEAVLELTGGAGVDAAIDGIGGDTLARTVHAVRPFGHLASIGQAGGTAPQGDLSVLGAARSLSVARPSVFRYMQNVDDYRRSAEAVLAQVERGLRPHVGGVLPLADAATAHRQLEQGRTTGSLVLLA